MPRVLTSVTVEPPTVTIDDDGYTLLTAIGHFDDASDRALSHTETHWTSSDDEIANVVNFQTLSGQVMGVAPGTATITVNATPHGVGDSGTGTATSVITVVEALPHVAPEGRFNLGFGANTLEPYPTWTCIDNHPNLVTSYSIDRGRSYELDQTDAGSATVEIQDPDGILDPTNPAGPYYGQIRPLLQAVLCRRNPVTGEWRQRYRGFVEDFAYEIHPSQRTSRLVITLVDLFELCSAAELQPGYNGSEEHGQGQVYYEPKRSDRRIREILTELGIPKRMWRTLPGNVTVKGTTYSAGESALSAMQEAADAEFPTLAGIVCDRRGRLCFRGRRSRFYPTVVADEVGPTRWDYHEWPVGDSVYAATDPTNIAQLRGFEFSRGLGKLINTAIALPVGAPDSSLGQQTVYDLASQTVYGRRSWSATDLLTKQGDITRTHPTNPMTETRRFAEFYALNYAQPRDRVNSVTFRSIHPTDTRAEATWNLLGDVDIGDTVRVHVHHPAGAGFAGDGFFVEGIHEEVRPLEPGFDDVTLTLDLSPRAYYDVDPWETPLTADDDPDPTSKHHRGGKPKTKTHARDHEHDGPDPIGTHFEDVGTGLDGDGGEVDLTGYIHYSSVPGANLGNTLDIRTTGELFGGAGTRFRADPTTDVVLEAQVTSGSPNTAFRAQGLDSGGTAVRAYTVNGRAIDAQADTGSAVFIQAGNFATAIDATATYFTNTVRATLDGLHGLDVNTGSGTSLNVRYRGDSILAVQGGTVAIEGPVTIEGDVYITGHLYLNGVEVTA